MTDTMILQPKHRHKTIGSSASKVRSPQRQRTPRYRRQLVIADVHVEPPAAFQEKTTQVVVAIQTSF